VAGSLKLGWVTASLFISKLLSFPRQNALAQALQEYGRLIKTLFILHYLESEEYRRRIQVQHQVSQKWILTRSTRKCATGIHYLWK
jgi:TnpA family transposase